MIVTGHLTEGFFGQALIWILELLPFVKRSNEDVTFEIGCKNYGVPPEYDCIRPYFVHRRPVKTPREKTRVESITELKKRHWTHFTEFQTPNGLWNEYFSFKPLVTDEVNDFVSENFVGRTLGIHFRGTDKQVGHCIQGGRINYEDMDVLIEDFCIRPEKVPDTIFVTSDEADFVTHVHTRFGKRFRVVHRGDSIRNARDVQRPAFYGVDSTAGAILERSDEQVIALGLDAICNALILSKCDAVLKTSSALSAWAKIFNPNLEVYRVNAFMYDWFPDAAIPLYTSSDPLVETILVRTLFGERSKA